MSRMELPPKDAMTPEQAAVCAEVVAGPRGRVPAPIVAWLRNPELARRAQKVGELLRFDTTLEPRLTELAILVCGRHWTSHHEWTAHKRLALETGIDPEVIADIAARKTPRFSDPKERLVFEISSELLANGRLSQAAYARGVDVLEERGLVELVATLGYYCMVSLTLNAFELGLPTNVAPELNDPDFA
jgi:4-carboxymuconolactone decarboxylase